MPISHLCLNAGRLLGEEAILVAIGAVLGWLGSAIDHRRAKKAAQESSIRSAYAEFFSRYSSLLQKQQVMLGLLRIEEGMREEQRPQLEAALDQARRSPDALQRVRELRQLKEQPPSADLNLKLRTCLDEFIEATRLASSAWYSVKLLDPDTSRRELALSVYSPPIRLPQPGDNLSDHDNEARDRAERFDRLVDEISESLLPKELLP